MGANGTPKYQAPESLNYIWRCASAAAGSWLFRQFISRESTFARKGRRERAAPLSNNDKQIFLFPGRLIRCAPSLLYLLSLQRRATSSHRTRRTSGCEFMDERDNQRPLLLAELSLAFNVREGRRGGGGRRRGAGAGGEMIVIFHVRDIEPNGLSLIAINQFRC